MRALRDDDESFKRSVVLNVGGQMYRKGHFTGRKLTYVNQKMSHYCAVCELHVIYYLISDAVTSNFPLMKL